jgi:glycosyltransferase involved in cell wall biosynthesis
MISLILCSHNGQDRIYSTLISLSKLNLPTDTKVELVFVDSNSTQSMLGRVNHYWEEQGNPFPLLNLRVSKAGKVAALRLGFEYASGEYFIVVDDDNELQPDYLEKGYNYLQQHPKVGVLGGQGTLPKEYELPDWFETYSYHFACGHQNSQDGDVRPRRNVVYGAGMWVRKEAYDKAIKNGLPFIFDFHATNQSVKALNNGGEDGEMCWAIRFQGYEIHYLSSLVFTHRIALSKFTDTYLKMIQERTNHSTLLGTIYYRVDKLNVSSVNYFWFKELFFIFLNYFKNFRFNYFYLTSEMKRNYLNCLLLFKMRSKYDEIVNLILKFKHSSTY